MRKSLLSFATVGILALTSVTGVYAQEVAVPTPEVAQAAAVLACTSGTPAACSAALAVLVEAIRAANPTASVATVSALVTASLQTVTESVQAAGGPALNIAAIADTVAAATPSATEDEDTPESSSPN